MPQVNKYADFNISTYKPSHHIRAYACVVTPPATPSKK